MCEDNPPCLSFPYLYEVASSKGKSGRFMGVFWVGRMVELQIESSFADRDLGDVQSSVYMVSQEKLTPLSVIGFHGTEQRMVSSPSNPVLSFWTVVHNS